MLSGMHASGAGPRSASAADQLYAVARALALVALFTAALAALSQAVAVEHVTMIYLIPILAAATRWGVVPAVVAAVAGFAAAAFFFYPPIYDLRVEKTEHIVDLILFVFVAVVTGQLATSVRRAKMRQEADALREALIGSVSHELRTPLSSIIGSASVLAQSPEVARDARLAPLVQGLREEADRLNDSIQTLLDATRISSAGIRPHPEWVDPGDIVNAAVEHKRRLLAGHHLKITLSDDLPLVRVDSGLVEKAVGQLIENAIKYSPGASPIEIAADHTDSMVRIAVRDRGSGLSAEEREKIWERFYRSPRHRDSIPGSGLGLWVARALVTACGGKVEAFSAGIGRGATLSVSLPIEPHAGPTQVEAADE